MDFECWSSTLYPFFHQAAGRWVIAFEDDGVRFASSMPNDDFYAPVPDTFTSKEGAEAAIAVLKAWDAPVANDEDVLSFTALRASPEWQALVPYFSTSTVGEYTSEDFEEATENEMTGGLPGAFEHYTDMILNGVQVL